jgi:hypothetical protein
MSMDSDIKAVTITASGVALSKRARVRGIFYHNGGGAGTLTLKDGSDTTVDLTLTLNANSDGYLLLPGRGILFETSVNCTAFTNITSVTLFYEG